MSDQQRSIDYFATYFGFDPSTARRYPDGVIIIRDAEGFVLALGEAEVPNCALSFAHFGFEMDSTQEVQARRARLVADGVDLVDDEDTETYGGFKCLDPEKHVIEVAWET